jgi:soluble lytic murein transglycosylase
MFEDIISKYAKEYKIPESLIKAIIKKESSFNPWAIRVEPGYWKKYKDNISKLKIDVKWLKYPDIVGASYGLMQVMLPTAVEIGFEFKFPTELLDPDINIKFGCLYLSKLYKKYKNFEDSISAYNQGNNRKDDEGKYKNQQYVDLVLAYQKEYEDK